MKQAELFIEAFEASNTVELMQVMHLHFSAMDDEASEDYLVVCFDDGSKAGWMPEGKVWLIA